MLHIGPYKTGSTAIQFALHRRRRTLRRHGVLYPGTDYRQRRPGWAVLENTPRGRAVAGIEEWQELVAEVVAARAQRVCISTENFGAANTDKAQRIVADLGVDRVHVVAVARRLDRLLPSQWQERVKTGRETKPYEAWLRTVLDPDNDDPSARAFRASHDLAAMIERWTKATGDPSRFTLIVTDDSDFSILPRTFETLLGLPAGMLTPEPGKNSSLSEEKVELLRAVNRAFDEHGWDDHVHMDMVVLGMQPALVGLPASAHDRKISPPSGWTAQRVNALSAERVAVAKSSGVNVIGDADRLYTHMHADDDATHDAPELISVQAATRAIEGAVRGALSLLAEADDAHARELIALRRKAKLPTSSALSAVTGPELIGETARRAAHALERLAKRWR